MDFYGTLISREFLFSVFGTVFVCYESDQDTPDLVHYLLSKGMGNEHDLDKEFHEGLKMVIFSTYPEESPISY